MKAGDHVGAYEVLEHVADGGMAQVFKVRHLTLGRQEALKVLPPAMTFDHSFVERFLAEARTAANLHHPHIVTIHTVSQPSESPPYFTMELVDGGDLADLLRRRGRLPLNEALPILRQIASALDYAHRQGIIHRDVKPANVLLQTDGQGNHIAKVVDFGIARAQEAGDGARLTKTGMIVGTPEYMSPEQGGSGAKVDARSDQYSLAVIAYEMLCGRPPFLVGENGTAMTVIMSHLRDHPRPPAEITPSLPLFTSNAILSALSKDPQGRFASCTDFVAALEGAQETPPARTSAQPIVKPSSPKKAAFMVAGVAAFAGVVLVGIGLIRNDNHPTTATAPPITNNLTPPQSSTVPPPTVAPTSYRFTDCQATSSRDLKGNKDYLYSAAMVLDGRHDTAWNVKNAKHGVGEWIQLSWPSDRNVTKIGCVVGYDKFNLKPQYRDQPNMWFRNNRLKTATLLFSNGNRYTVTFSDTRQMQYKAVDVRGAHWMKLLVNDVYLDMYGGKLSRWDDLAISEIEVDGR